MRFFKKSLISKIQSIKKLKMTHQYFLKDTAWVTLNQIITVFLGVLLSVILARFTTQEVFGEYNFILSIVSILSIVAIPGLNTSMLRSISRGMDGVYIKAVRLSFMWSLLGVPILFLIGAYYYYFSSQIIGVLLFVSALFFPFLYAPNNWVALLQGKKKFDIFAKYSIIQTIIRSSTIIIAVFFGKGSIIPIFMAFLFISGLSNIIFYYKCKSYIENNIEDKQWEKSGYKLTLNDFVNLSYDHIDKIFIGIFLGPVELAIYAVAVSIVSSIKGAVIQIMKVVYPKIFAMDKEKLKFQLRKTMFPLILLNTIFLVLLILIIPPIMLLLYSEKYFNSIIYAQLYSITISFSIFMVVINTSLIALNEENAIIKFRIIGLVIVLLLYAVLIPFLGILGAILSSIIYYVILVVLQFRYLKSK